MNTLSLTLFGNVRAFINGQSVFDLPTKKVQALLLYLATEQETEHRRESLMILLWPGILERSARHNLRQTVYHLRKNLPEVTRRPDEVSESDATVPLLLTNRQTIRLHPEADVRVDVSEFESQLAATQAHDHLDLLTCHDCQNDLEKAVGIYLGDFLNDFYLEDSNEFEEWAQAKREYYRRRALDALETLTTIKTRQKEFSQAEEYAERQLAIDNLRESAYRQSMEILALSGRREEALALYETCRRLFADELGMAPAKRTTEIYEKILEGDLSFDSPLAQGVRGYELKEEIGHGAYGAIHRALQPHIGREVAVKVIRRRYANNPEFIRRFEAEAQMVAQLEHPHIVPLYDYWREPAGAYLVMRLLRGGSLLTALEGGPWEPEAAAQMMEQIGSALAAAHRQGIIHRDIKPANILFDEGGNAYLTDFGIAKVLSREVGLTADGVVVGTPDYISPEQIKNEPLSPQTDIYSLGAILYETLTGEKPFPDSSVANLIYNHLNEPVPLVTASQPNLPTEVDQVIQRATAKRPADRYDDALELATDFQRALGGIDMGSGVVEILRPSVEEIYNPYKGLRAFQEADAGDFFGREALIEQLVRRLETATNGRFLALVGPSGSGKSSVVKAGLIPALRAGAIPGSEKWFVAEMVPGSHPLEELELALWPVAVDPPPSLVAPMERDVRGMLRMIRRVLPAEEDARLLLVIDQFEELFTLVEDEERRAFFIDSLLATLRAPRSPLRVVVTLRADFYDRPLGIERLGRLIKENTEVILPLTAEELTWAVREPARPMGVGLEKGLAEAIVADVADQPGALPLLQYALTELFERRHEGLMTQDAYREVGGVLGALGRRAEAIYADLDKAGQELVRQLFLRLVTLGEGVEDTRRRVPRAELKSLAGQQTEAGDGARPADASAQTHLNEIIDAFGRARLLTFDHDPATRRPTVEVAHEALLRDWGRLRHWLDDSRDDIRQERALLRSAEEWVQHDRDESFLLRGLRLEMFESWQETSTLIETPLGHEFISQSLLHRDRQRQAETERRERELGLERRSRTLLRGLLAVFVLATLVSLGLVLLTLNQRQSALKSAADAQNIALVAGSQAAFANDDTDTALALAWKAVELHPDSAIAQAQLSEVAYAPGTVRVLTGNEAGVSTLAISPDDKTVFAGANDGTVILWELASGQILWERQAHELWVQDVAFSADGRLAAATFDDRIMLWQAADGQLVRQIESNDFRQEIAFDPNGRQFATIGSEEENRLKLWDINSGAVIRELNGASGVEDIAYTGDGSAILLASGDGALTLVDVQSGQVIYEVQEALGTDAGLLPHIAISPDGSKVAGGFTNAGLVVWDLQTGKALDNSFRYDGGVFSLAFHPEDGTVLIGGEGTIQTLNLETGEILRTNTGHSGAIIDLALTSDGKRAVTTAIDETVRLWDLWNGQVVRRYAEPGSLLFEVALSPDGQTVLIGSTDGTVTLKDVETGAVIHQFATDQPVMAVAFSPDGQTALVGAGYRLARKVESGHVILLDVETGEEIRRFEGQPYAVYDVEFSPDGRLAASSGNGAMAILWDVETGEEIRRFEDYWLDNIWPIESYWDIEFSPDGRQLYASHASGPIIVWDLEDGEMIQELVGHNGAGATGIAFSRDGQQLVSGGWDSQAILWDMGTGDILRRFDNHAGPVGQVRFSPDETLLLGGSGDGSSSLWGVDTGEVIRRYGGGFVISPNFSRDGHHAVVGYNGGAVELWRIDSTLDDLLTWTRNNRYIPELTCEQRELYLVEPLCEPKDG